MRTRGIVPSFDEKENKWTLDLCDDVEDAFKTFEWWNESLDDLFLRSEYSYADYSRISKKGYGFGIKRDMLSWKSEKGKGIIVFSNSRQRPGIILCCDGVEIMEGKATEVGQITLRKPIIYVYAPKVCTPVTIGFGGNVVDHLIAEIPARDEDGLWHFCTGPDGILHTLNGQIYDSIFWEATRDMPYQFVESKCWYTIGKNFSKKVSLCLDWMGLNPKEIDDFVDFWGAFFKNGGCYKIQFLESEYTSEYPLLIEPEPAAMRRVFMIFEEVSGGTQETLLCDILDKITEWERPLLKEGPIVIEWGGACIDEARRNDELTRTKTVGKLLHSVYQDAHRIHRDLPFFQLFTGSGLSTRKDAGLGANLNSNFSQSLYSPGAICHIRPLEHREHQNRMAFILLTVDPRLAADDECMRWGEKYEDLALVTLKICNGRTVLVGNPKLPESGNSNLPDLDSEVDYWLIRKILRPFKMQLSTWIYWGPVTVKFVCTRHWLIAGTPPRTLLCSDPDIIDALIELISGSLEPYTVVIEKVYSVEGPGKRPSNWIKRTVIE